MKRRLIAVVVLLALLPALGGCNYIRWLSTMFWPDQLKTKIKAQYTDMADKSVAVVVTADEFLLHRYPTAPDEVARAVAERLQTNLPSVTLVDPVEIDEYLEANPYWDVVPYSKLVEGIGAERIILIELIEYRTHEPGNAHIWQGMIAGNVGVLSADADDPNSFVFQTVIREEFPENNKFGVVDSSDEEIRLGMHSLFSRDAAGLFYDYVKTQPRL